MNADRFTDQRFFIRLRSLASWLCAVPSDWLAQSHFVTSKSLSSVSSVPTVAGLARAVTTIPKQRQAATFILDFQRWFIQSDTVMKTKTLLTLFAVICAASITAQTSNYTAAEAAKHVGETATVTDRVDGVHQSGKGNIFLNMGGKYPNQAFTAFIPSSSAGQFSQPQQYEGQMVAVSGKITLYRGKPEIIVNSPSQISAR